MACSYDMPSGCTTLVLVMSNVCARSKISWAKKGISVAALALSKSIAVCRVPPASGTPVRVARYFCRSALKSNSRTVNSAVPLLMSEMCGKKTSTSVAPALCIAVSEASNAASTCGLKPSKSRATPMRAPLSPLALRNFV